MLYAGREPLADGGSEQFMLFLGNLHLVKIGVLDLVLGILVLVLRRSQSVVQADSAAAKAGTYPEHSEVVVTLLHGIIHGIDEARIVFAALGDIVCACARRRRKTVAHDLGDELRRFLSAILKRLVGVRIRLEDKIDIGLDCSELGPVVTVPVV